MRATPSTRRRRRRRGAGVLRWAIWAAVFLIVFAVGVAVGQALEDRPEPAQPVTSIRTIQPWTQTETRTDTEEP